MDKIGKPLINRALEKAAQKPTERKPPWPVVDFMLATAVILRLTGEWKGRRQAKRTQTRPTVDMVHDFFYPAAREILEWELGSRLDVLEEDRELVRQATAWVWQSLKDKPADLLTDFEFAVVSSFELQVVPEAHAAAVAAFLMSWREGETDTQPFLAPLEAPRGVKEDWSMSRPVGEKGKWIDSRLFVRAVIPINKGGNITFLHKLTDEFRNQYLWFATGRKLEVDQWYQVTGKIRKHEHRNGVWATVIGNCSIKKADSTNA